MVMIEDDDCDFATAIELLLCFKALRNELLIINL